MTDPALDSCLELIANRRRREIIRLLRAEERCETTVDALLERLAREDVGRTDSPPDPKPLAVELYHIHLPKLAAHGVIEYEPGNSRIRYRPDSKVEAVLESLPDDLTSVPT
jgi:hypothetical protein